MGSLYDETAAQFYVGSCAGIKSTAAGIASDFGARKRDFSCFVGIGEGTSATISSSKEHATVKHKCTRRCWRDEEHTRVWQACLHGQKERGADMGAECMWTFV